MEPNITPLSSSQLLYNAALQGDLSALQDLFQKYPFLIHRPGATLHLACKLGHTHFALELLRINPSLSEELDPNDNSSTPLHVASRNGHLELVKLLVSINPSVCLTRDMAGMNPVHVAAVKGHIGVVDELLRVVPCAAREQVGPVGGGDSIMHLCVKFNRVEVMRLVVGAVGDAELLNAVDGEGNTVLHVAVANKRLEIVRFLLSDGRVTRNTPNSKGLTPMDIFNQSHKDVNNYQLKLTLKRFKVLASEDVKKKKDKHRHLDWLENQRSAVMVVASLIATMAFQAGINPPGGAWQDNVGHVAGSSIMGLQDTGHYNSFIVLNTVGLLASMSSIILLISGLPCRRFFLAVIMVAMWVAITSMTLAYGVVLYALTPFDDLKLVKDIIVYGLLVWLFVVSLLLLGHVIWWTARFLKKLGRLVRKLFRCCFPKHRIA